MMLSLCVLKKVVSTQMSSHIILTRQQLSVAVLVPAFFISCFVVVFFKYFAF